MSKLFSNMKDFFVRVSDNISFILVFLLIVVAVFLIAYIAEKMIQKAHGRQEKILTTRKMAMIGMFSAISGILMMFEIPLPFIAPSFYELDFSELPVLICGFCFGPVAGVVTEFLKVLIKLLFKSTSTAFVGDLANFVIGCTLILPATIIYYYKKTRVRAITGCVIGTVCMTVFGTAFNAVYLLPTFAIMYFNDSLDVIIGMGAAINPAINNVVTFVIICVAPMNLIKGGIVSILTMLVYKPLSPIIKHSHQERQREKQPS